MPGIVTRVLEAFRNGSETVPEEVPQYTDTQMRAAVSEAMDEAAASAERILAIDNIGYSAAGQGITPLTDAHRRRIIRQSRVLSRRDGMAKHIVTLWVNFGVGTGISWQTENDQLDDRISELWKDPTNKTFFSMQGQRGTAHKFLDEGDLFIAVFAGSPARIRLLDALQITAIATDAEDKYLERVFVRETVTFDGKHRKYLYRSADNPDDAPGIDYEGKEIVSDQPGVVVYHVRLTGIEGFGDPLLTAAIEWILADRDFMRGRAAVIQQMTKVSREYEVKGGPQAVQNEIARQQSFDAARTQGEPPPHGLDWTHNEGVKTKTIPPDTAAKQAQVDSSMLTRHVGVAVNLFNHYMGDGDAFRLATATAMEPPIKKTFQVFHLLMREIYMDITALAVDPLGYDVEEDMEIDQTDIWPADVEASVKAITSSVATFPELQNAAPVLEKLLSLNGFQNPGAVLDEIRSQAPAPGATPTNQQESAKNVAAILKELREAVGGKLA